MSDKLNKFEILSDRELAKINGGESGLNWNALDMIMNAWGSKANYEAGSTAAHSQYNPYDDF